MIKKLFFVLIVVCILTFVFLLLSHFKQVNSPSEEKTVSLSIKKDINHDGKVDYIDSNFFTQNNGCKKDTPCWKKQITKTYDGDNPVYVYDLDLDNNGIIDANDAL
jgi:hypothetical protein